MKYEKLNNIFRNPDSPVKVIEMGNIVEIVYTSKKAVQVIRMLPNGEYLNLNTGEIKTCVKHENRISQEKNLLRTFRNLRAVINSNVIDTNTVHWITLTYAENMMDSGRLYTDFRDFNKRWKRYIAHEFGYHHVEYIVVAEPQKRGAWHCHLLYMYEQDAPYVPNDKLREIWRHGFVSIKKLDTVDNVGAYLTAYLTNLPLDDNIETDKTQKTKALLKGARLHLYPAGFRIFRTSKGIKRPVKKTMTLREAEKQVAGMTKTYENSFRLIDEQTHFELEVNRQQFNKIRKEG
jgi:hypothetical protein